MILELKNSETSETSEAGGCPPLEFHILYALSL